MVPKGGFLPELPNLGEGRWCNAGTGEPIDVSQQIWDNMRVHWLPE
jgi:hypothetical protein